MQRLGLSLAALISALLWASVSSAQPGLGPPRGGPGMPGRLFERHAERLGLDAQTLDRIRAIVDESRERGESLREEILDARTEMHRLLDQDQPDEAAVLSQAEIVGSLETAAHKHRLSSLLRIHALLTADQREELKRIREDHASRRGRWGRKHRDCPERCAELGCGSAPEPG